IEDLRNFLADDYRLHSYALSAPSAAARHFTAPGPQFVVLGWGDWSCILQVLTWIRAQSDAAVIVVGPADETVCVAALERGADGYVFEPVSPRELLARIRAVVRFRRPPAAEAEELPQDQIYAFAGWEYDERTRRLLDPRRSRVSLTRGEHALLKTFL